MDTSVDGPVARDFAVAGLSFRGVALPLILITVAVPACSTGEATDGSANGASTAASGGTGATPDGGVGGRFTGGTAGTNADAQVTDSAPDAAVDYPYTRDHVPAGYPDPRCIPPCLWELLVACDVPDPTATVFASDGGDAGADAASQAACFADDCDSTGCYRGCDREGRVVAVTVPTSFGGGHWDNAVYVAGQLCMIRTERSLGGGVGLAAPPGSWLISYVDASGRVVAELDYWYAKMSCGAFDDPASVYYEASGSFGWDHCTASQDAMFTFVNSSGYGYCDPGTCPEVP